MNRTITRSTSVHFYHKFLRGVSHDEVLPGLYCVIDQKKIKAVQITDKACVITLNEEDSKNKLLQSAISVKGKTVKLMDVENTITNVTVKDAPVEMPDHVIIAHLTKYGHILQGSCKRGYIKGTDIENGTRYLKIINCIQHLPVFTSWGRFNVRLFADNGRTPCMYCNAYDHPSYRCMNRAPKLKECFICGMTDHLKYNCPNKQSVDNFNQYGEYMHDIEEGKEESDDESLYGSVDEKENIEQQHDDDETLEKQTHGAETDENKDPNPGLNVILGASNCTRITTQTTHEPSIINAAISGITLALVDKSIQLASKQIDETPEGNVEHVIFNLGTNDVTRSGQDADKVKIAFTEAIQTTKSEFQDVPIGVCSILPRKGKSNKIAAYNGTTKQVNSFIAKMCEKDEQLTFINLDDVFLNNNIPIKAYYDLKDNTGVHISTEGAEVMKKKMYEFCGLNDE